MVAGRGGGGEDRVECGPHLGDAPPGAGVADHDRRTGERGAGQVLLDLELGDDERVGVDEIGLGERDEPVADAEQLEDPQVLLALGHPALGGRDDEQGDRRPPRPRPACS